MAMNAKEILDLRMNYRKTVRCPAFFGGLILITFLGVDLLITQEKVKSLAEGVLENPLKFPD